MSTPQAFILLYIITIPYKDKQRPHNSLQGNRCFSCNFGTVFVLAAKISTADLPGMLIQSIANGKNDCV